MTYTIYLNGNSIATVEGCEAAYTCYEAAKTIAEMTGQTCSLVWSETAEVVASFDPNGDEDEDYDTIDADTYYEMGFDPYEGCYTYDC